MICFNFCNSPCTKPCGTATRLIWTTRWSKLIVNSNLSHLVPSHEHANLSHASSWTTIKQAYVYYQLWTHRTRIICTATELIVDNDKASSSCFNRTHLIQKHLHGNEAHKRRRSNLMMDCELIFLVHGDRAHKTDESHTTKEAHDWLKTHHIEPCARKAHEKRWSSGTAM